MCGIFLILSKKNTDCDKPIFISKLMSKSFIKTKHRGPDNSSISLIDLHGTSYNLTFGFHRLKIMDTSDNGNQPFKYEKDYVMCNGEIYNHDVLKKNFSLNLNIGLGNPFKYFFIRVPFPPTRITRSNLIFDFFLIFFNN